VCVSVSAARACAGVGDRAGGAPDNIHAMGMTNSALNVYYVALTPYITTSTKHATVASTCVRHVNYTGCVAKGPATRPCRACASRSAMRVWWCVSGAVSGAALLHRE